MNENDTFLLEILEKFYDRELLLKNEILTRFSTLLTIFSLLAATLAFYLNNTPYDMLMSEWWLWLPLALTIAPMMVCVVFAAKFLLNHAYGYLPSAASVSEYADALRGYNDQAGDGERIDIQRALKDLMRDCYSEAAGHNRTRNRSRSADYHRAISALFIAAIFAALSAIPYFYNKQVASNEQDRPTKQHTERILMADTNQTPKTPEPPKPAEKPKVPDPPKVEYIKEGSKVPERKDK